MYLDSFETALGWLWTGLGRLLGVSGKCLNIFGQLLTGSVQNNLILTQVNAGSPRLQKSKHLNRLNDRSIEKKIAKSMDFAQLHASRHSREDF